MRNPVDLPRTVLVVSQLPPPTHGSTVMTQVLLDAMRDAGIRAALIDRRFSKEIADVGAASLKKVLAAVSLWARLVWAALRHPRAPIIYFMTTRGPSFVIDSILLQTLRLLRKQTIGYIHTRGYTDLASRGHVFRKLVSASLQYPNRIVSLGQSLASDVSRWVPATKLEIIPNTPLGEPRVNISSARAPVVLFYSNVMAEKGPATFVELALSLAERDAEVTFELAGGSTSAELDQHLRDLSAPLGDRIVFVGRVEASKKWDVLSRASVLVFPSTYGGEAQPLSIIEAMAVGTPVVAYDTGGVRDLIQDGLNGHVVPQGDLEALIRAASEMLYDTEALRSMSNAARTRYEAHHSFEAFSQSWMELLRRTPHDGKA